MDYPRNTLYGPEHLDDYRDDYRGVSSRYDSFGDDLNGFESDELSSNYSRDPIDHDRQIQRQSHEMTADGVGRHAYAYDSEAFASAWDHRQDESGLTMINESRYGRRNSDLSDPYDDPYHQAVDDLDWQRDLGAEHTRSFNVCPVFIIDIKFTILLLMSDTESLYFSWVWIE